MATGNLQGELKLNHIYQGDCLEVMKSIPDKSVDMILTDIPYNVSQKNNFCTMTRYNSYKGCDFGEWDKGFETANWLDLAIPKLKEDANVLIFCSWQQLGILAEKLKELNMLVKRPLVLKKINPIPANRDRLFVNSFEFGIWACKGKWTFNRYNGREELFFEYAIGRNKFNHPTIKPLKAIEKILKILTNANDLVLDPFIGSGTTAIACIKNNRNFIGIEKDAGHYKTALNRIEIEQAQTKLNLQEVT